MAESGVGEETVAQRRYIDILIKFNGKNKLSNNRVAGYKRKQSSQNSPLSSKACRCILDKFADSLSSSTSVTTSLSDIHSLALRIKDSYSSLHVEEFADEDEAWLVISRLVVYLQFLQVHTLNKINRPHLSPISGPLANPRLCVVTQGGSLTWQWQILFKTIESGQYSCLQQIKGFIEQLVPKSGFRLCPGIDVCDLHFETKNLRKWGEPFQRFDSKDCFLWHIPMNVCCPTGDQLRDVCAPCRGLKHDINKLLLRAQNTSDKKKLARQSASSKCPIKQLSPTSKSMRMANIMKERKLLSAKVSALTPYNFEVKDKQHAELLELVRTVHKKGSSAIEELCKKGDKVLGQEQNMLRQAWRQDVIERLEYERDQTKSG